MGSQGDVLLLPPRMFFQQSTPYVGGNPASLAMTYVDYAELLPRVKLSKWGDLLEQLHQILCETVLANPPNGRLLIGHHLIRCNNQSEICFVSYNIIGFYSGWSYKWKHSRKVCLVK